GLGVVVGVGDPALQADEEPLRAAGGLREVEGLGGAAVHGDATAAAPPGGDVDAPGAGERRGDAQVAVPRHAVAVAGEQAPLGQVAAVLDPLRVAVRGDGHRALL